MNGKWISIVCAALLLGKQSLFSQDSLKMNKQSPCAQFKQGEPIPEGVGNFSLPAVYDVRKCGRLSGFLDISFIYWYLREEGLGVALNGVLNTGKTYLTSPISNCPLAFSYHPGFKISGGLVIDHEWKVDAEYTWIRSCVSHTAAAPSSPTISAGISTNLVPSGTPIWSVTDWFLQGTSGGQEIPASQIKTVWRLNVDIVDLMAGRPYYQGRLFTLSPSVGLRAMWLRQQFEVDLTQSSEVFGVANGLPYLEPGQPIRSINYLHSWALGPRFATNCNFLLPIGFRFEGDLAFSILYTQYTATHKEDVASTAFSGPIYASFRHFGYLRPVAETGLGIGWGKYCGRDASYHIDFLAAYDFTFLWNQNVMRTLLDDFRGTSPASGNLFFHGLTLTGRFDF